MRSQYTPPYLDGIQLGLGRPVLGTLEQFLLQLRDHVCQLDAVGAICRTPVGEAVLLVAALNGGKNVLVLFVVRLFQMH